MMTAANGGAPPTGLRILVDEDEMLLAMTIEDLLDDWGYSGDWPRGLPRRGAVLAGGERLDGAIWTAMSRARKATRWHARLPIGAFHSFSAPATARTVAAGMA
jgi:hypothetical protein